VDWWQSIGDSNLRLIGELRVVMFSDSRTDGFPGWPRRPTRHDLSRESLGLPHRRTRQGFRDGRRRDATTLSTSLVVRQTSAHQREVELRNEQDEVIRPDLELAERRLQMFKAGEYIGPKMREKLDEALRASIEAEYMGMLRNSGLFVRGLEMMLMARKWDLRLGVEGKMVARDEFGASMEKLVREACPREEDDVDENGAMNSRFVRKIEK
jgi:hypothetical protein